MLLIACAARSAALAPGAARRFARRVARGAASADGDEDRYRGTVLLPETTFPQRASAKTKEPEIQACRRRAGSFRWTRVDRPRRAPRPTPVLGRRRYWDERDVYGKLREAAAGPAFALHDGPPRRAARHPARGAAFSTARVEARRDGCYLRQSCSKFDGTKCLDARRGMNEQ